MRKAPRRGLRLAKFQFLLFLLVCFLLPDVIADDLFRHTDGADAVAACPKVVAREVALPPQILPMNADRRLPFQEPPPCSPHSPSVEYPTRHARDPTARALPPTPRRAADTTPERFSQPHVASRRRSPFPILRHPHHVISTIPSDGGLAQGWSAKIAAGFRRKLSGWSVVMTEYTGPGAVVLLARHCPRVW